MRLVAPFLVVAALVALCVAAELERRYTRSQALAEGYAGAVAACANGKSFTIGRRVVTCIVADVP